MGIRYRLSVGLEHLLFDTREEAIGHLRESFADIDKDPGTAYHSHEEDYFFRAVAESAGGTVTITEWIEVPPGDPRSELAHVVNVAAETAAIRERRMGDLFSDAEEGGDYADADEFAADMRERFEEDFYDLLNAVQRLVFDA